MTKNEGIICVSFLRIGMGNQLTSFNGPGLSEY